MTLFLMMYGIRSIPGIFSGEIDAVGIISHIVIALLVPPCIMEMSEMPLAVNKHLPTFRKETKKWKN